MEQKPLHSSEKSAGFWIGAIFIVLGLVPIVSMFFKPEGLNVALPVAQVGVSALVFAGLSFIAQSQRRPGLARAFSICVVLVLVFVGLHFLLWAG